MGQDNANMAARYEHEIPEGYEARIEGNKVIIKLKESEDEMVRTRLIALVEAFGQGTYKNEMLAYLEKQKYKVVEFDHDREQKPAEWSKEDEAAFGDLMWCMEQARKSAKDENDMGNIWFAENWVKNMFKSLRPQPHWKPSEGQMEALKNVAFGSYQNGDGPILRKLYNDLKKIM